MKQWAALPLFLLYQSNQWLRKVFCSMPLRLLQVLTGGENTAAGYSESQGCQLAIFRLEVESYT